MSEFNVSRSDRVEQTQSLSAGKVACMSAATQHGKIPVGYEPDGFCSWETPLSSVDLTVPPITRDGDKYYHHAGSPTLSLANDTPQPLN
ncbi:MAG: hypothetical protein JWO47_660 [Candidatus Saccharibacteria bacterium]|nr:hypothetical protein [Candidatus Saccharibacteria bacterium]